MKLIATLALLLFFSTSFSQWIRVQQLPSSDIFSLYHKDSILYAGGKNIIYFSRDKGQSWDSTSPIPVLTAVDNIIVYKNQLYAASYRLGVFKSPDGGNTWKNAGAGIFPFVSDFCEWQGNLYAATYGSSVFKSDTINNNWVPFNDGLSSLSANLPSIAGNNNALIAGTLANGMYDYLPANSTSWEERFLIGQIRPTEGVYDIITAHDSLFLAGSTGSFYLSTNNGLNWNTFADRLPANFTTLVNAKQALLLARNNFDGVVTNASFYYIKKDVLQGSFVNFSIVPDHFTYKMEIIGNKLFDASSKGLFFMSLSDLPGISGAADSTANTPLPVKHISFDVQLKTNKTVSLQWKTGDENNIDHFEIERSANGINWKNLANVFSLLSREYSYTDLSPDQGINYYRIKETDIDGKFFYSTIKSVIVENETKFLIWPNPASDVLYAQLPFAKGIVEMIDASGRILFSDVINSNNIIIPMLQLKPGEYFLRIHNDKATLIERFIKQ